MSTSKQKKISLFSVFSLLVVALGAGGIVSLAAYMTLERDIYLRAEAVSDQIATSIYELTHDKDGSDLKYLDSLVHKVLIGSPGYAVQIVSQNGKPLTGAIFARNFAWESKLFSEESPFAESFGRIRHALGQQHELADGDGNNYLIFVKRFHGPTQYIVVATSTRSLDFEILNRTIPWGIGSGILALLLFAFSLWLQTMAFGRGHRAGSTFRRVAQRFYSESISPQVSVIPAAEDERVPDYVPVFVVSLSAEGLILAANNNFLNVLHVELNELSGRLFVNLVHEDDQEKVRQSFRTDSHDGNEAIEFRLVIEDESVCWVRVLRRRSEAVKDESVMTLVLENINNERRVVESLIDVKTKLNLLIRRMPSLMWVTDNELKIKYSAGNGASQLNEISADFAGRSIYELFDSQDGSVVAVAAHLRALRGEAAEYEFVLAQRNFEVAVEPRKNSFDQIVGTIAIARDVTIALQTERALRESEQRFRDVAEASSDWIWELDRNYAFNYLSERFMEVTRLSPNKIIGLKIWELADTETEREKWEMHQQRLDERLAFRDFVYRVKPAHTKGRALYFKVSGRPVYDDLGNFVGYRGTGTDISGQVEAESRAATAERRLAEALNTINEGVALWDADDRLVFCNTEYRNLYPACASYVKEGVLYSDLVKINLDQDTYADVSDPEVWLEDDLKRHRYPGEPFVQKLRDSRQILVSEKRTHEGGIIGIRTDISQNKQHEAALYESRQRTQGIMNAAVDGIVTVDDKGIIESYNPAAQRMFGYSVKELMGQDVLMLIKYSDAERFNDYLRNAISGLDTSQQRMQEFIGVRRDQNEFPIVVSIADMRLADRQVFTIAIHDVTARKQAEEALSETEDATRGLYRIASVQNIQIEAKLNSILELGNERFGTAFAALSHIESDRMELVAVRSRSGGMEPGIVLPLHHSYCEKTIESARVLSIDHAGQTEWAKHSAYAASKWEAYIGTRIMVRGELYGTLYFCSPQPHRMPFSSIDKDILQLMSLWVGYELDRRMGEQQLREHQSQLAHVGRLSTMGEMATGLAHELNQPLAAIVNYSQGSVRRLQSGTNDEPEVILQALKQISDQAARAGGIIRRLREFVKKRSPHRGRANINEVIQSCISFVDLEAKKAQVTMKFKPAENVSPVEIDSIEIEQVLINLFVNAIDAMNAPGCKNRELNIKSENVPSEKMVKVTVKDSGPGMTEDAREHVFDAFFTTKSSGMGMGLSISRSLIEAHKGRLWVESELGHGATFRFTVPIYDGVEHGGD